VKTPAASAPEIAPEDIVQLVGGTDVSSSGLLEARRSKN
jgi:hypothetical protein